MTVKQLSLPELTAACRELGVGNVGLWREPVQAYGVEAAANPVRGDGPDRHHLCRGGFLTATDAGERAKALADNRRAVDEAATLGTDTLVLVSGGLPAGDKDLRAPGTHRRRPGRAGPPTPSGTGVRLAIEPLHPMYAADRCVVSTLTQALDLAERFPARQVGVTVDTYHIWWDDRAPGADRPGRGRRRIHPSSSPDWTTPLPEGRPQRPAPDRGRRDRHAGVEGGTWRRPGTPAPSRSSCSTRSCGRGTGGGARRDGGTVRRARGGPKNKIRRPVQPFRGSAGSCLGIRTPIGGPGGDHGVLKGRETRGGTVVDRAPRSLSGRQKKTPHRSSTFA
ncbi:sugar phosphate isomerase/epimerase [Streptomyces thinghirensis]|nr:sugar phosphate isomerase/epimerase [Streptomyces thinghirensis]